jgi:solute carrier family 25 2-oxodicarboxylate transporter 21
MVNRWGASLAGASAGVTECAVNTPFEVVKVRMQAKENLGRYKGSVDCVQQLLKERGLAGLYKGVESQMWRNAVWNGVYFGMIGSLKKSYFKPPPNASSFEKTWYDFLGGFVGGTCATLANTPFDTVKSRIQNQIVVAGQTPKYVWTLPSLVTVISEEGVAAAYKGIGPRLLRLGPGGGIMIVMFNAINDFLKKY